MSGFGGTVKLTGESEYKKALKDIGANLKLLNSEMKLVTSQYDENDSSTQQLVKENKLLNEKIEEQKNKVDVLKSALEKAKTETGDNSKTTQKWQTDLNNAQAELNRLNLELDNNTKAMSDAEKGAKDEAGAVEKFGKEADKSGDKALSLGDIIKANLISDAIIGGLRALGEGIVAVGTAMKDSLSDGAAYADNILTLSTQTGVSTENLQKYNAVAELVDVSTETMTKSMAKNIKSMTTASSGTGAMAEAYKKLGVSVTDAEGNLRDGETVYWETIDALKNVTYETERDSIAMELLGKSAQELNPLIAQGSEGIKAMGDEAVKMGAVLSEDALNGLGAVDDEMQRFSSITGATSNIIASAFAPNIADVMMFTNELGMSLNGLISTILSGGELDENIFSDIQGAINDTFVEVFDVVDQIVEVVPELVSAIVQILTENLPTIFETGAKLLGELAQGIVSAIPQLLPAVMRIIETLLNTIIQNSPMIIEMGMQMLTSLIQGISRSLPELTAATVEAVSMIAKVLMDNLDLILASGIELIITLAHALLDNLDMVIDTGIELIFALADGLLDATPDLLEELPVLVDKLCSALEENLPKLVEAGIELTLKLAAGILEATPQLLNMLPQLVTSIAGALKNSLDELKNVGKNLVEGLWNGIKDATSWVLDKIKGFGTSILNGIKDIFGIHSPSKVMEDEVGTNLALGVGGGFAKTMEEVSRDMQNAIPTEFDSEINTRFTSVSDYSQMTTFDIMLLAFKQALTGVKVMLDDREMGTFVVETVEKEVFA